MDGRVVVGEELTSMLSYQYAFMIAGVLCWWYVGIVVGCRSDRGGAGNLKMGGQRSTSFSTCLPCGAEPLHRRINDYTIMNYDM